MYLKNSDGFTLVRFAVWSSRWIEKLARFATKFISGTFPCTREPTIFPFFRSNQRSGCLRHSTFDFYILSAMPARSPGAIVGDFENPIERPFFLSLRPSPRRDVSTPFACLLSASFLRLRHFFSIDITPSRLPIARPEKFRATQQSVRFFYWLLSCFRYSKRALSLHPFVLLLSFLFTHLHAKDSRGQQNDIRKDSAVMCPAEKGQRGNEKIILVVISAPRERYSRR